MATQIPRVIADLELQLATAISIGDTSFTLSSATDDDGVALPAGEYVFAIDTGTSNKEYLLGQLNGVNVTSVYSVSRQGVQTSGAVRSHRVGAAAILTNFAALQLVADTLRGAVELDGSNPLIYDTAPTLADGKQLATVQYVLDNIVGGTVAFDAQIITGNAGETVAAGDLIYFNTSDQEWYKTDADTSATVDGVQIGIALGAGTDGAGISGGIQIAGSYTTTGLTAGSLYYASNTAAGIGLSSGTTNKVVGFALSTTRLLLTPQPFVGAFAGGDELGIPSSDNKFLTEQARIIQEVEFTSSGTWTKDTGLQRVRVRAWAGGGGGGRGTTSGSGGGGGGGGYMEAWFEASELSATESVTIGTGGAGRASSTGAGSNGGNTTFGSLLTAYGGEGGGGAGTTATGGDGGDIGRATPLWAGTGASGALASANHGVWWGGGGGNGGTSQAGGNALYGGGGGAGKGSGANASSGGVSQFGGNGGAATVAGTAPGGGGGGNFDADGAAGAAGKVIVTEYYV